MATLIPHIYTESSLVVGHAQMIQTCSFMCTSHKDMTAHTLSLMSLEHSMSAVEFESMLTGSVPDVEPFGQQLF